MRSLNIIEYSNKNRVLTIISQNYQYEFNAIFSAYRKLSSFVFHKTNFNSYSYNQVPFVIKIFQLPTEISSWLTCMLLNLLQKELYKLMLNSFYGRFALHTNFTHHYFCRTLAEKFRPE